MDLNFVIRKSLTKMSPGLEPSRGCFPVNETLFGARVAPAPSCSQVRLSADTAVRYCSCDTDLCNVNLYNFSEFSLLSMEETRVKRHRVDVPDSFMFPFEENTNTELSIFSESDDPSVRGVKCYDCGSLFSHASPHCPEFDAGNATQQRRCQPGQVCLLYQWSHGDRHETGEAWSMQISRVLEDSSRSMVNFSKCKNAQNTDFDEMIRNKKGVEFAYQD